MLIPPIDDLTARKILAFLYALHGCWRTANQILLLLKLMPHAFALSFKFVVPPYAMLVLITGLLDLLVQTHAFIFELPLVHLDLFNHLLTLDLIPLFKSLNFTFVLFLHLLEITLLAFFQLNHFLVELHACLVKLTRILLEMCWLVVLGGLLQPQFIL